MSIVLDLQSQSNWIITTIFSADLRLEPIFYYLLIKKVKQMQAMKLNKF